MKLMDRFMLTGKKAVVTGGARGIGESIAIAFAEMGADVAVLDILEAQKTVQKVRDLGRESFSLRLDLNNEERVKEAFQEIEKRFKTIDIVFNNAGIVICKDALEMSFKEWQKVLNTDLSTMFLVAKEAAKIMINNNKGGSIINTASMSAHIVNYPQGQCAYNAAKAGVVHLTKSLAVEWAKYNIRVNAISPGYILTPMTPGDASDEWINTWLSRTPMERFGKPEELQGAVVYLASDAASFTTGTDIIIDGGFTCI